MNNDQIALIVLFAGAVLVLAIVLLAARARSQRQRSAELRGHFGPEYDRAVTQYGNGGRAERELESRQRRLDAIEIVVLSPEQCARVSQAWSAVQQRFVDDPSGAVIQADGLVKEVMRTRGYPMGNFDQRVADLSVDHAGVVDHYRAARKLAVVNASGQASTENLRQAMVHYRALFTDLLQTRANYSGTLRPIAT
jgi:hypothetical protein